MHSCPPGFFVQGTSTGVGARQAVVSNDSNECGEVVATNQYSGTEWEYSSSVLTFYNKSYQRVIHTICLSFVLGPFDLILFGINILGSRLRPYRPII
jgi:hypothetical protein